tara:strand:+ start:5540 stop:6079 length:540 start_codon:yes stop_codon:yes gene_type:complete
MFTIFTTLLASAHAFVPTSKPDVKNFAYFGDVKPLDYFDPLSLSSNLSEEQIKYVRESELQHARVAMAAFVGLSALDIFQDKLAVNVLYDLKWEEQIPFWMGVGAYEFARMGAGWKNPFLDGKSYFRLEDDYQPGNVLKMNPESITERAYNVELSNGRLAMFACLGYLAEEYVTKVPIF